VDRGVKRTDFLRTFRTYGAVNRRKNGKTPPAYDPKKMSEEVRRLAAGAFVIRCGRRLRLRTESCGKCGDQEEEKMISFM